MKGGPDEPSGDRVEVRGLRVDGVHGVLEDERTRAQPFEVDLDLYLDTAPAASSDDLQDSADYAVAVERVVAVITGPPHFLLESLAGAVAHGVLEDPRVDAVTVTVRKLRPPLDREVDSTGVRVHRGRPEAPAGGGSRP